MDTGVGDLRHDSQGDQADVLLDLGELEAVPEASNDFVLELDDDLSDAAPAAAPAYEATPVYEAAPAYESAAAYESAPAYESTRAYEPAPARPFVDPQVTEGRPQESEIHDSFADTQEVSYAIAEPEPEVKSASPEEKTTSAVSSAAASVGVNDLSPEMIDAIARRAVELMSDKVIREIAWEVVPDLAELLIKKQLEETK